MYTYPQQSLQTRIREAVLMTYSDLLPNIHVYKLIAI